METSHRFYPTGRKACGIWVMLLAPVFALQAFCQETVAPDTKAAPAASDIAQTGEPVDLRTLVQQVQRNAPDGERANGGSVLSVRGRSDGTIEVRDASGKLLQEYPLDHFYVSGKISAEAVEKVKARVEVLEKSLADRKGKELEAQDKQIEAAKEAEANAKEQEKASEVKWREEFKAKSAPYLDRKTNSKVNAVKIDAREIREDGTYLYEGKAMKPVRLFNKERSRYEMVIPVPATAE